MHILIIQFLHINQADHQLLFLLVSIIISRQNMTKSTYYLLLLQRKRQQLLFPRVGIFIELPCITILQGVPKRSRHSWETKTLGTSYLETTNQLDLKLWQQGVLMRTPCCQRVDKKSYDFHKMSSSFVG